MNAFENYARHREIEKEMSTIVIVNELINHISFNNDEFNIISDIIKNKTGKLIKEDAMLINSIDSIKYIKGGKAREYE